MSESNRIRVVGYAQRVFYNDGIEYRNFSENIVGNELTENDEGESSVFTFGNFVTTTNYEGRATRLFSTKKFSDYYDLDKYNLIPSESNTLVNNNVNVTLNLDNTDLSNLVYFGSATEFIRVTLESIITNWPASLYLSPLRTDGINTIVGDTVSNYSYNPLLNKATFEVDTNFINNKFDINFLKNGTIINTFNEKNSIRNLTVNFNKYVILINNNEYNIISFTGASSTTNDTIIIETSGDPFGFNGSVNANSTYHIKPNSDTVESFFNGLSDYESNLLNRLTIPKYSSTFQFQKQEDDGTVTFGEEIVSWPVSDGYNIDFDTTEYVNFVNKLLEISKNKDGIETNLMTRFLTAQAISDFDTLPSYNGTDEETAGQKMNKTLKIYGREFDEIKKYIDGISFANVVSYDKKENTPDQLVKYLARVLGWELTSSIVENDLIKSYLNVGARSYAGYSRGLTPAEAEIELWRRLILNSSWIWKSKGTRKAIEFFFKLIGTPDGLIDFDEYVYVAKEPIDMDLFYATLENNDLDNDLSLYNVDSDGYPKFLRDTPSMYFQKGGQWYRETGGENASQYILAGNNPHVGPYDGGKEYINQLENIIPSFTPFTLTSTTVTTGTTKLFTNYNSGLINQYSGDTYVTVQNNNGVDLTNVITTKTNIIKDPFPQIELTDCGCDIPEDDECLQLDVQTFFDGIKLYNCNNDLVTEGACTGPIDNFGNAIDGTDEEKKQICWNYVWNSGFWSASYFQYDLAGNYLDITTYPGNQLDNGNAMDYIKTYRNTKFIDPECCNLTNSSPLTDTFTSEWLFNNDGDRITYGFPYYHTDYVWNGVFTICGDSCGNLDGTGDEGEEDLPNGMLPLVALKDNGVTEGPNEEKVELTARLTRTDVYEPIEMSWEVKNSGYLCLRGDYNPISRINPVINSEEYAPYARLTNQALINSGPSPLISYSWVLNGPSISDMEPVINTGTIYDTDGVSDYYLKFKKPDGTFTITSETDTRFYPPGYCKYPIGGVPEVIIDPYTGKGGYPCRLSDQAKYIMTGNPTYKNRIYQTFLQRAMQKINAGDYIPIVCQINPLMYCGVNWDELDTSGYYSDGD